MSGTYWCPKCFEPYTDEDPCDCTTPAPSPTDVGPEDLCEPTSPDAIRFLTSFPKSESLDHLLDAPSPTDELDRLERRCSRLEARLARALQGVARDREWIGVHYGGVWSRKHAGGRK